MGRLPFPHLCLPDLNPHASGLEKINKCRYIFFSTQDFSRPGCPLIYWRTTRTGKQLPPDKTQNRVARTGWVKKHTACCVWSGRRDHPHSPPTPTNTPAGLSIYPGALPQPRRRANRKQVFAPLVHVVVKINSCVFFSRSCRWKVEAEATSLMPWETGGYHVRCLPALNISLHLQLKRSGRGRLNLKTLRTSIAEHGLALCTPRSLQTTPIRRRNPKQAENFMCWLSKHQKVGKMKEFRPVENMWRYSTRWWPFITKKGSLALP